MIGWFSVEARKLELHLEKRDRGSKTNRPDGVDEFQRKKLQKFLSKQTFLYLSLNRLVFQT